MKLLVINETQPADYIKVIRQQYAWYSYTSERPRDVNNEHNLGHVNN